MPRQDIAPCPGGLRQAPKIRPPQGLAPVTDAFPAGVRLHLLETGIQVIRLSPCHADLSAPPLTSGHGHWFSAMLFSLTVLSDSGKASDPEISPLISARCAGDTAVRLMAHSGFEPCLPLGFQRVPDASLVASVQQNRNSERPHFCLITGFRDIHP